MAEKKAIERALNGGAQGGAVGAESNLSHRADRILSQGWKPTSRWSAVDKYRLKAVSATSLMLC